MFTVATGGVGSGRISPMQDEIRVAWADDTRLRRLKGTWLDRSAMQAAQARVVADAVLATGEDAPPNPRARPNDPLRLRASRVSAAASAAPFLERGRRMPSGGLSASDVRPSATAGSRCWGRWSP
jgi:hypothetical protein